MTCVSDVILMAVLLICIVVGCSFGMFYAINLFRKSLALTVAGSFNGILSSPILKSSLFKNLEVKLYNRFYNTWSDEIASAVEGGSVSETEFSGIFGIIAKLFPNITSNCLEVVEQGAVSITENAASYAAANLVLLIVDTISFVLIYAIVYFIFGFAYDRFKKDDYERILADKISELFRNFAVIADKILGGLLAAVVGIWVVWVLAQIVFRFFPSAVLESNGFTMWLYSDFFLSKLFEVASLQI